jgi:hypothetical protein
LPLQIRDRGWRAREVQLFGMIERLAVAGMIATAEARSTTHRRCAGGSGRRMRTSGGRWEVSNRQQSV